MDIKIKDVGGMPEINKVDIDFSDPEATIVGLIDLAHHLGKGQKPGTGPAIMSLLLRDMAKPWVDRLYDCVKNEYQPVEGTIAICRTFSLLLALTILHSSKEGMYEGAVNTVLDCMREDTMDLVRKAAANMQKKGGDPTDLLREMLAKVKPAKGEVN